jgi:hypothetical protein
VGLAASPRRAFAWSRRSRERLENFDKDFLFSLLNGTIEKIIAVSSETRKKGSKGQAPDSRRLKMAKTELAKFQKKRRSPMRFPTKIRGLRQG